MDFRARRFRPVVLVAMLTAALLTVAASPPGGPWQSPIESPQGSAIAGFDPPAERWLPGHRGVDLSASPGTPVRAPAGGAVSFAGMIAGRGVVVVVHGRLRSTFEPVDASVRPGQQVAVGEVLGYVGVTSGHCAPGSCLHWGVRDGDTYLDPLSMLSRSMPTPGPGAIRLLPLGDRALTGDPPSTGPDGSTALLPGGRLAWPAPMPYVTSPFGMRTHPVTGVHKLHDGTDFRARCGAPIRAAAPGVVTRADSNGAYGLQVAVDHGTANLPRLSTSYSHLSRIGVRAGQQVRTGQIVGWSGTTGRSTGCHLHFMVHVNGVVTDPMRYLRYGGYP